MSVIKNLIKYFVYLLLVFFTIVVVLNYSYHKNISIPDGITGMHVEVDGIKLRVLQKGNGPDLLFLHGSIGSIEDLEAVMPFLGDYRVTLFDRIGHGYSAMAPEKANIKSNARFASALIKKLNLKDVTLLGHSYGGSIALQMAINKDPGIKSLVLLAPAAYSLSPTSKLEHLLAQPIIGLGLIRVFRRLIAEDRLRASLRVSVKPNQSIMPKDFENYRINLWNNPGILFTRTQQTRDVSAELVSMQPHYNDLAMPITILLGSDEQHTDIAQGCKLLAKTLKNGQLIIIEGAGHYLHYKAPKQISEIIKNQSGR